MVSQVGSLGTHNQEAFDPRARATRVRIKTVALPIEHGGWGLSLEPVALGLLVAPSVPGLLLSVATLAAFLARHPLKIVAADRRRGRRFPRTPVAERFAAVYCAAAALALIAAFWTAGSVGFLLPLLLAAPLASVQLFYDAKGRSRELLPELAGSIAMASVAAALALAGGWSRPASLALWAVLAARVVPSVIYVRARLRQLHSQSAPAATARSQAASDAPEYSQAELVAPTYLSHLAATALVLALALAGLAPWLAVVAVSVLLLRAAFGVAERGEVTARRIGLREIGFGAFTVLAVALGYLFGL
jgi:hypothetical protein